MDPSVGDSFDRNDYSTADEFKDFFVCSGMVVFLATEIILRYVPNTTG